MDELKEKLAALGLNEDQVNGSIETFVDFIKSKMPPGMEGMVQSLLESDLSGSGDDILEKAKGLFGG